FGLVVILVVTAATARSLPTPAAIALAISHISKVAGTLVRECALAWRAVASPNVGNCGSLSSVSAVTATDIWAVGYPGCLVSTPDSMVEHWDGQAWSVVPITYTAEYLHAVAAVAANDVWAVGGGDSSDPPLIEHWNGMGWT